jgi:hypothetical protein
MKRPNSLSKAALSTEIDPVNQGILRKYIHDVLLKAGAKYAKYMVTVSESSF